ncbi:MAG: A/G-specific adenine glycosylase [Bacteroidales bacterium]|nr:A/G-specific adenine glycosylase [Bacteroidales bacterium]
MKISEIITEWYKKYKRQLPWRSTSDPYRIWLSEIILQQTRVSQGLDYYIRFVEKFPDVQSLAAASEETVMKFWQGLGYYSRARNMHQASREIVSVYNGKFPGNYDALLKLKGVGPYTAAAVASIAFGEPVAVVDGNVSRVLGRLFAVGEPVNSTEGARKISELAFELLDRDVPGNHNQAIMEFGALQCTPVNPNCRECPLNHICESYRLNASDKFPLKLKQTKRKNRYFTYFVIKQYGHTYIRKRTGEDIWKSMYEFPMIEQDQITWNGQEAGHVESSSIQSGDYITMFEIKARKNFKPQYPPTDGFEDLQFLQQRRYRTLWTGTIEDLTGLMSGDFEISGVSEGIRHHLTHRIIHARFIHINMLERNQLTADGWKRIRTCDLSEYPLPRLIDRYLEQNQL